MSVYLLLTHIGGEWLLDGGSTRRVCSSGADLLDGLRDADRSVAPELGCAGLALDAEPVRGGWVVRWPPGRTMVVRDDPDSADRLWSQLTEQPPSLQGFVDRVEALGYGGAATEAITFALGDEQLQVTRGQLRVAGRVMRGLKAIGKAVSISPKPTKGGAS
jgi:hypothetical protein